MRKAVSSSARTVYNQKNKKIEVDTFLYNTGKGPIDTAMLVAPIADCTLSQGEDLETIGTVELRLYITRQLDVFHTITSNNTYDVPENQGKRSANYRMIRPTLQMEFEQNCGLLERSKLVRENNKLKLPRPGTEPWAIFCFHYRNKGEGAFFLRVCH